MVLDVFTFERGRTEGHSPINITLRDSIVLSPKQPQLGIQKCGKTSLLIHLLRLQSLYKVINPPQKSYGLIYWFMSNCRKSIIFTRKVYDVCWTIMLTIADMMTPKVGLVLVLAAVTQLSSGMALTSVGVEKCEPSIIPRSVS